jgi:hypothetical protein
VWTIRFGSELIVNTHKSVCINQDGELSVLSTGKAGEQRIREIEGRQLEGTGDT